MEASIASSTRKEKRAFDRIVGCVSGNMPLRTFLDACNFVVYTDYKPHTFALAKEADPWSALQQRHLTYISEYAIHWLSHPSIYSTHKLVAGKFVWDGLWLDVEI